MTAVLAKSLKPYKGVNIYSETETHVSALHCELEPSLWTSDLPFHPETGLHRNKKLLFPQVTITPQDLSQDQDIQRKWMSGKQEEGTNSSR